jgi:Ras-related protein Rab-2A/Rab family protein
MQMRTSLSYVSAVQALIDSDMVVVANKTDLVSDTPPPLPDIAFGQAVPPSTNDQDDTPSPPQSPRTSRDTGFRQRSVTPLEGALFAKQNGLLYVETSAKEGWHVVDAFEWTAREVLATVSRTELERRKVSH